MDVSPEPPRASPTTKNPENGPKTSKNRKNRKFGVGGRREAPSIKTKKRIYFSPTCDRTSHGQMTEGREDM